MRVLLVSTYESGHQPLHVASPAGALRAAGHDVRCLDLAVQPWDPALVDWAQAAGFSVPMHTAMRLALRAARAVKRRRGDLPVCFYGLYAPVSRDLTLGRLADHVIAGEYEPGLLAWIASLEAGGEAGDRVVVHLGRGRGWFAPPARDLLPPLERYARLHVGGERRLVGYVEATHGCRHVCRHCPVPTVYEGAIRVVDPDVVVDDIAALVDRGARHITFGDPDFLNAPGQARRVVGAMHERFPTLTFDCTVKVEHVLRHAALWDKLAGAGCLFVVTALESIDDCVLRRLDKGHTAADAVRAVAVLRDAGIEPRPSWLPFTPWTTPRGVLDVFDFVADHDLVENTDPVQYTIRLLLPEGSLLLDHPDLRPHLGPYDPSSLSYAWTPADPRVDDLQRRLAALAERHAGEGAPQVGGYAAMRRAVEAAAGATPARSVPAGSVQGRPRLTEPWFC
ncbi:MAG: CUAEP/CCAEP-tail radical SAM protein [Actinomycetota bacterium]|nr:CUAEP/CCAEP-tail radical SAM protein [Actinomycetota bacterium]